MARATARARRTRADTRTERIGRASANRRRVHLPTLALSEEFSDPSDRSADCRNRDAIWPQGFYILLNRSL